MARQWGRKDARVFKRKDTASNGVNNRGEGNGHDVGDREKDSSPSNKQLPMYNQNGQQVNHAGHQVTPGIQPDGESGRKWFSPLHFFRICWTSSCTASRYTNILWPFTIAALVLHFGFREHELWIFICAYIGMVPAANLVGFAGQEFARKMPKVAGVMIETTFGSIVEIILFTVLITKAYHTQQAGGEADTGVIRAAILGSILANMLLCLGLCFFVGGIFHPQQVFHEAVSEVGSNLMLVAGMALVIPTIYYTALINARPNEPIFTETVKISRATAIVLLVAFIVYVWFQARSHHGLYEDILEADEERDHDRHKDLRKPKLTLTESILALLIALAFVSFMAVFLVEQIPYMREERHLSDSFLGLILIPIVEKASEHITAVDEAYDNQMNFALSHVLGASIQTALLNTPIVVIVGWGLGVPFALNFEMFDAIVLILAIIVVGNFLRDEKSDYLEGALCVFVYMLITIAAFYYPNPIEGNGEATAGTAEGAHGAARMMLRS